VTKPILHPDARLRNLLGLEETVDLETLSKAIVKHLTPPEPLRTRFTIDPSGPRVSAPDCYDLELSIPLPMHEQSRALATSRAVLDRDMETPDSQLVVALMRAAERRRRRDVLLGFAEDPVAYMRLMVAVQGGRELRHPAGEGEIYEVVATEDIYKQRWTEDAVLKMLARRAAAATTAGGGAAGTSTALAPNLLMNPQFLAAASLQFQRAQQQQQQQQAAAQAATVEGAAQVAPVVAAATSTAGPDSVPASAAPASAPAPSAGGV
jgi:hypothetical protein